MEQFYGESEAPIGLKKFEWPLKSDFLRMQEAYVQEHKKYISAVVKVSDYGLTPAQIEDVAIIVTKAQFVAQYIFDHSPVQISFEVGVSTENEASHFGGSCSEWYSFDNEIMRLKDIPEEEIEKAKLIRVSADVNIAKVAKRVKEIDSYVAYLESIGYTKKKR